MQLKEKTGTKIHKMYIVSI